MKCNQSRPGFELVSPCSFVAYIYILDTYRRNDNRRSNKRRMIKTQWQRCKKKGRRIKMQEGRHRKEDAGRLLYKYSPLTLLQGFERVCSRFACERVLETVPKLHILTPLLWPSRCVFLVLLILGSTPSGVSEGPLGRVWPSLPHLVSTVWKSAGNCFGTPNSTELNNNSTPTQSPTGSLKSNV